MQPSQRSKELETILVLIVFLIVLYWFNKSRYFLVAAVILGIAGAVLPPAAKVIHWVWMKLAEGLGLVTGKILLTLVFILLVIPLGWITRKSGKSSIRLKPGDKSYFTDRNHIYQKKDLEHPW